MSPCWTGQVGIAVVVTWRGYQMSANKSAMHQLTLHMFQPMERSLCFSHLAPGFVGGGGGGPWSAPLPLLLSNSTDLVLQESPNAADARRRLSRFYRTEEEINCDQRTQSCWSHQNSASKARAVWSEHDDKSRVRS